MLNSVAAAQTNYKPVSITDFGAWVFVKKMVIDIYSPDLRRNVPVVFSEPLRRPQLKPPQKFSGMSVWSSDFGLNGDVSGEIRFYVSSKGHVFAAQIFYTSDLQLATTVFGKAMQIVGLNENETDIILNRKADTVEIWCSTLNCRIIKQFIRPNSILLFAAQ